MQLNSASFRRVYLAVAIVSAVSLNPALEAQIPAGRVIQKANRSGSPHMTAQFNPAALSYSQLGDMFFQWNFSIPVPANPMFDNGDCKTGQSGPVWFLGGTDFTLTTNGVTVGQADRTCVLPGNVEIFFPIINSECSDVPGDNLGDTTEAGLRACAKFFTDFTTVATVTLDNISLTGSVQRVSSGPGGFQFGPLPGNNVLQFFGLDGKPGSTHRSVSEGYYLRLGPLPAGNHTLKFFGEQDFGGGSKSIQDITYHLIVQH